MRLMPFLAVLMGLVSCASASKVINVNQGGLQTQVREGAFLLDVRTDEEFTEAHIPGAANADWYQEDFLDQVQKLCPVGNRTPLVVYCRTGRRSAEAAAALSKAGYTVYNLLGGITEWIDNGMKVEKLESE